MDADIKLHQIASDALNTFPPLGDDNSAASNHAQRMLTKILSQKRKSGQNISDETDQALRAELDCVINTIEVPFIASPKTEPEKPTAVEAQAPQAEQIDAIISDCFHTATDGSPEHLKYLHSKANAEIVNYLRTTNAGFITKFYFNNYAKRQIRRQTSILQNG